MGNKTRAEKLTERTRNCGRSQKFQLRWAGQVIRRDENIFVNSVSRNNPEGRDRRLDRGTI